MRPSVRSDHRLWNERIIGLRDHQPAVRRARSWMPGWAWPNPAAFTQARFHNGLKPINKVPITELE